MPEYHDYGRILLQPLVLLVLWRSVADVLSIGLVTRICQAMKGFVIFGLVFRREHIKSPFSINPGLGHPDIV